jgi:hypothetical protein
MKGGCREIIAGRERVLAKMGSWLVKMKATEVEILVEQQAVLNEELNDGDLCLAVRRRHQPKELT